MSNYHHSKTDILTPFSPLTLLPLTFSINHKYGGGGGSRVNAPPPPILTPIKNDTKLIIETHQNLIYLFFILAE